MLIDKGRNGRRAGRFEVSVGRNDLRVGRFVINVGPHGLCIGRYKADVGRNDLRAGRFEINIGTHGLCAGRKGEIMAHGKDWLPSTRDAKLSMAKNWCNIFAVKGSMWNIPGKDIEELRKLTNDANNTLNIVASVRRTGGNNERCKAAFKVLISKMRDIKKRHFFCPPMCEADFVDLGLNPPAVSRTDHIVITEEVEFHIEIKGIRRIHVHFKVLGTSGKAKPAGYDGAVIVWDILDSPPSGPEKLNRHALASKTPYTIEFQESERGKTAYVALRWQNERAYTGPWSEVLSAIVP